MQVETGPLTVTWPVDYKAYSDVSNEQVMGKHPIASSLNHSVRILLAGTSAYRPSNKMKTNCCKYESKASACKYSRIFTTWNLDEYARLSVGVRHELQF